LIEETTTETPETVARRMLEDARTLMASRNGLISVSGERVVAILADLLMDIDPSGTPDPWSLLVPREARR
jgi:hypothetical protein